MKKYLVKIPAVLIWSRLAFAMLILFLSVYQPPHFRWWINILLIAGLLSDIFDGIIARRLQVSTVKLRRMDSTVDQVFWLSGLVGAYIICTGFFLEKADYLLILLGAEAMTYVISFVKFKKEVATHAILSKLWTLTILAALMEIIARCDSNWIFMTCFWLGIITRLEIVGILLVLRKWESDVPSLYHALMIRQGKDIKRNRLFNG